MQSIVKSNEFDGSIPNADEMCKFELYTLVMLIGFAFAASSQFTTSFWYSIHLEVERYRNHKMVSLICIVKKRVAKTTKKINKYASI